MALIGAVRQGGVVAMAVLTKVGHRAGDVGGMVSK